EVDGDGGEDGDRGQHEDERHAASRTDAARMPRSRRRAGCRRTPDHQKSSAWVRKIFACVVYVFSLPSSSLTVSDTRTRGGTSRPPVRSAPFEFHSARHSRSFGSHASTENARIPSASTPV